MDRRQALKLLTALGATGLVGACGKETTVAATTEPISDEPVKIGMIAPGSGVDKPIGDELIRGFELYLDLHDGRLGGHPVDLVKVDEGRTVQSGKAALDKLLKQNVLALTGVANSSVMLGLSDMVEKARVPLVGFASPAALQSVLYIWRTSYVDDEPGRALGPYMATQVRKKGEVAIVAADYSVGRDGVTGFRRGFGESDPRIASPVIWAPHRADPDSDTYAQPLAELRNRDPDALYCVFPASAAGRFIKQLRASGYRGPVYAPGLLTEGLALNELGKAVEGIQTALNYSADLSRPANRRFATAFRKAYDTSPTSYAMSSYDAAQVLDKAIRLAGENLNPQQLNLALGKVGQIDSPRGAWQFNQSRTPEQRWYLREVRRDGQLLANMLVRELATLG